MVDDGLRLYFFEAERHLKQYQFELDELAELEDVLGRDYRAAERLLQLLTELAIGLSKHWLKSVRASASASVYQGFLELNAEGLLSDDELIRWKKVIGFSNALVHDYLTVNQTLVKQIIQSRDYLFVADFCVKAIEAMRSES